MKKLAVVEWRKQDEKLSALQKLTVRGSGRLAGRFLKPYTLQDIVFCGVGGLHAKLFHTESDYLENPEAVGERIRRLSKTLETLDAEAVMLPKGCPPELFEELVVCQGKNLFAMLMMDAILKCLWDMGNKPLKTAKIAINHEDDDRLTHLLLDVIGPHVNSLAIVSSAETAEFEDHCEAIFEETGLVVPVLTGKQALANADIVINTGSSDTNPAYFLSERAAYFELSGSRQKALSVARSRPDVSVACDLMLFYDNKMLDTSTLETLLYMKHRAFRALLQRGPVGRNLPDAASALLKESVYTQMLCRPKAL